MKTNCDIFYGGATFTQLVTGLWATTTETGQNTEAYGGATIQACLANLLAAGAAQTSIGRGVGAYNAQMRPMGDFMDHLTSAKAVYLRKLKWWVYDSTLTGAAGQDAAVIAAIYASRATDDAFMQSPFRVASITCWQPSFFRPSFRINGKELYNGIQQNAFKSVAPNNAGDMSYGLNLPYCHEPMVALGKVTSLEPSALAGQLVFVAPTWYIQRYPLGVEAEFITE